jgi:basic membrane protein A
MPRLKLNFRLIAIFVCALLLFAGSSLGFSAEFKMAVVMPGVITDKGFNQAVYEGILLIKKEMGIEGAFSEKVAQPDQSEALADYARRGYQFVIGAGGEFQDSVDRVAGRYPDTKFAVINGTNPHDNVSGIRFYNEGLAYAIGYIGGKISKTGAGGFVGAQQIAFSVEMLAGFTNGFMAARPDGKVYHAWTNDWDDIAKGKEAAFSMISKGADVIFPTMDNACVGSLQAAKEKKVMAFGIYYDAIKDWPDTVMQSAILHWPAALLQIARTAQEGKLEPKLYTLGFELPSAAGLGTYHAKVPQEVKDEMDQVVKKIISGEINPMPK